MTYRHFKLYWVSGWCVVSCHAVKSIMSLDLHKVEGLPSDHAPININVKVPYISKDYIVEPITLAAACH